MSKFFKALQQAEQDRAQRVGRARDVDGPSAPAGPAGWEETVPAPEDALAPDGARGTAGAASSTFEHRLAEPADAGPEGVEEHLVSLLRPSSFEAEQYRALSHLVERLRETSSAAVVGISSPAGGDGKTVTAINLAGALAQDLRSRVLLLEADLRRPTVATYLGIGDAAPGLIQFIARPELGLKDALTVLPGSNFDVLVAGHPSSMPYEALKSPRVEELLQQARQCYDYVVVDTPPLVAAPEARVIEKLVDGLFVVVCAHRTLKRLFDEALRLADETKVIGLVFNGDDRLLPDYGWYRREGDRSFKRDWGRQRRLD